MSKFFPASPKWAIGFAILMGSALLAGDAMGDVTYDIRAQTKDKIKHALIWDASTSTYSTGNAKQGSFGAPSINDKGNVAYACILSGSGITALTQHSVAIREKGTKYLSYVAFQSGFTVDDSFLYGGVFPVFGTGYVYRIGINVAINNRNKVAYSGELIYVSDPPGNPPPVVISGSTYGEAKPVNAKKPHNFYNYGLVTYTDFNADIFEKTLSINSGGSIAFNGKVNLSSTEQNIDAFGFAYPVPSQGFPYQAIIATAQTPVIGLPYFATFQSFTDAIISKGNAAWVVAQLSDAGGTDFDGIWQGNNPDIQPVVIITDKAPGGGTFTSFGGKIGVSRNAKICAFTASTSNGNNGVFRANQDGTDVIQIVGFGDKVPSSVASGSLGSFSAFTLAAANDKGQVAILGTVNGSGTPKNAIWVTDKNGENLTLIVVEGQSLTVNGKDKTVTKIAFNPVSGINAKGQVAFTASFTDRTSAVIVAHD